MSRLSWAQTYDATSLRSSSSNPLPGPGAPVEPAFEQVLAHRDTARRRALFADASVSSRVSAVCYADQGNLMVRACRVPESGETLSEGIGDMATTYVSTRSAVR
jgi:hypothetical protein